MLSGHRVLSRRLFQFWGSIRFERFERPFFSFCLLLLFCSCGGGGVGVGVGFVFRMSSSKPEMHRLDREENRSKRAGRCTE